MILDDGTRLSTARNLIRSYGNATPVEYYTHFIVPTLPHSVKSRMEDLFNRLPEERKKTVSLEAILEKQKYFENNL